MRQPSARPASAPWPASRGRRVARQGQEHRRFLGPDYGVRASVGHVADLSSKGLAVAVDNDFTRAYERLPWQERRQGPSDGAQEGEQRPRFDLRSDRSPNAGFGSSLSLFEIIPGLGLYLSHLLRRMSCARSPFGRSGGGGRRCRSALDKALSVEGRRS